MFEVQLHKTITSDLPYIEGNYLELLADEYPILYTGTNKYGNRILGVVIEESDDFLVHYFHVIIDDVAYYSFIDKKLTLREVLKFAPLIFVVSYEGGNIIDENLISYSEIPEDYLPLEDSYCPDGFFIPSLNFGVSLKGKLADNHLVEIQDANQVQTSFGEVLINALRTLDDFELNPVCYLEPAETGSFRVNYRIEFKPVQSSLFQVDDKLLADYLKGLLNFIIDKLPNEEYTLNQGNINSEAFTEVEAKLERIYESSNMGIPANELLEEKLIENINKSALKFEEVSNQIRNSNSFARIELVNYEDDGGELGLGVIDQDFFDSIKTKLVIKEHAPIESKIEEDQTAKTYRVRVYHLNTESGNCWAYFYPDESEYHFKIPIRIRKNEKEYHNSILSKSLDEKKVISIIGYAERTDGKVSSITIDL